MSVLSQDTILGSRDQFIEYAKRVQSVRQAFMILTYEGDFENIKSLLPAEWQQYHPEALRIASQMFSKNFSESINGEQKAVVFTPPKRDGLARKQEGKAVRIASEKFLAEKGYTFNSVVATADEVQDFKNKYSLALSNILGLYPDYREKPEVEEDVKNMALQNTTDDLNKPEVQKYLSTIDPEERFQFESSLNAANFVKAYKYAVVASGDFSGISPAQPGRFQKFRQRESIRNNKVLTRLVRAAEAFVAGDQLEPGRTAQLERNIPAWYDFKKSNGRIYAGAITRATASYLFNYLVWGLNLPAHLWTLGLISSFTIGVPSNFLTRFFNYQGAKPMGKLSMMSLFALIYTWSTFWGEIPQQIFAGDFQKLFDFTVGHHLPESLFISTAVVGVFKYKDAIIAKAAKVKDEGVKIAQDLLDKCRGALGSL